MRKLITLVAFAALALGAPTAHADTTEQLIASWQALGAAPGACQEQGCEARLAISKLIEARGYCYEGRGPDKSWRRCK